MAVLARLLAGWLGLLAGCVACRRAGFAAERSIIGAVRTFSVCQAYGSSSSWWLLTSRHIGVCCCRLCVVSVLHSTVQVLAAP